jgi:hypothetical protein
MQGCSANSRTLAGRLCGGNEIVEGLGAGQAKHLALVPDGYQALHCLLHLHQTDSIKLK